MARLSIMPDIVPAINQAWLLNANSRGRINAVIEAVRGPRVLDVGCGWGFVAATLAAAGLAVDATDTNEALREVILAYGLPNLRWTPWPPVGGDYDTVLFLEVWEHVADMLERIALLELCRNAMSQAGRFLFSVPTPGRWTPNAEHVNLPVSSRAYLDELGAAGFSVMSHEPVGNGYWNLVIAKGAP